MTNQSNRGHTTGETKNFGPERDMKAKQNLLFGEPRNFHIMWLEGKPVGSYSLKQYCSKAIGENDLSYYDGISKVIYITRREAIKEKIEIQREHYKRMKKAIKNGEDMLIYQK